MKNKRLEKKIRTTRIKEDWTNGRTEELLTYKHIPKYNLSKEISFCFALQSLAMCAKKK